MKLPTIAPTFSDLLERTPGDRLAKVLRTVTSPLDSQGRYLHWDQIRRRQPPGGLTHEEWWLGLKFHRQAQRQPIPLLSTDGRNFSFLLVAPILEALHRIDFGAGGSIGMPEPIANPDLRDRYIVNSLIEEAITSSQLEGAGTTRLVANRMLRSGRPPRDRSERMILNNYQTMRRIRELRYEPLSPELILELQRRVTLDTLDAPDAAGRLRRGNERVEVADEYGQVFHTPPRAEELPHRLEQMCRFANDQIPISFVHPVIRAMTLHFWLAFDHPFVDGNGRCARALFYWSMLHSGFWLAEFISISHVIRRGYTRYYRSFLYTETDENDLTYFLLYHVRVIQKAIDELHGYLRRKMEELRVVEAELRGMDGLNHRQKALLSHALRHPHERYTIYSHQMSHNVVYETARTDLLHLADRGYLLASKQGRTWMFRSPSDLAQRMRSHGSEHA